MRTFVRKMRTFVRILICPTLPIPLSFFAETESGRRAAWVPRVNVAKEMLVVNHGGCWITKKVGRTWG